MFDRRSQALKHKPSNSQLSNSISYYTKLSQQIPYKVKKYDDFLEQTLNELLKQNDELKYVVTKKEQEQELNFMREQVKLINEDKGFFRQKFRDEQENKKKNSYIVREHFNTFCK